MTTEVTNDFGQGNVQPRTNHSSRRLLRVGVGTVLAVCVLSIGAYVAFPSLSKRASRKIHRSWLLLTGRLVDVGGYRLRIDCQGTGSPAVIFDSGLGQRMETWGMVPSEVSRFTRACTYERAGVGLSDSGPGPRTSKQIVGELHTLLANKGIQGPYVLVGHSFGGLNVRLYANQYRNEVAGMVLVDASHEDQYEWFAAQMSPPDKERYLRHEGGRNLELVDILASAEEIRGAASLPNVPLIVLSAGQSEDGGPVPQAVQNMQTKLAQLVTGGKQITAENSDHFIQLKRPFMVADAIFVVVRKARDSSTVVQPVP